MEQTHRHTFWTDAAKAGGVTGLILAATAFLSYVFHENQGMMTLISFIDFFALAYCIYHFGKRRAALYDSAEGFSYGQSMGYILAMMLFTGFIVGIATFVLRSYIAPEYYQQATEAAMSAIGFDIDNQSVQTGMELANKWMNSPVVMILNGMFSMALYGAMIGLIASVFIKKQPNPFANQ